MRYCTVHSRKWWEDHYCEFGDVPDDPCGFVSMVVDTGDLYRISLNRPVEQPFEPPALMEGIVRVGDQMLHVHLERVGEAK